MTISPARLTELLSNDATFIASFIATNNPTAVADRIADVLGNRPVGLDSIFTGLQVLLDNGRTDDFVHVLSVPISLGAMSAEQVTAVYQAVGIGTTPDTLGRALAINALRLWSTTGPDTSAPAPAPAPAPTPKAATPTEELEKRNRLWRYAAMAAGAVVVIIGIAYAIRIIRKS